MNFQGSETWMGGQLGAWHGPADAVVAGGREEEAAVCRWGARNDTHAPDWQNLQEPTITRIYKNHLK